MTPTKALHDVGVMIWGRSWPIPMGRATGVNSRTLQRCFTAHHQGLEYPGAGGALEAVYQLLERVDRIVDQT